MTVISILDAKIKEDALESAPALITSILETTRAFAGSLGVEVAIDADDPAHFLLVERWDSIESDDAYRAFRATPEGASGLADVLAAPPVLTRAELTDI
jgi:heme oxygenase (mycobilin-producing)